MTIAVAWDVKQQPNQILNNMLNFEIGLPRNALCYLKEELKFCKLKDFQDGRFLQTFIRKDFPNQHSEF